MSRLLFALLVLSSSLAMAADANRLTYLDEYCDPYYPHRDFAKLTTPQWVGEPGVECVVVLSIDDMRDPEKYEAFLRPILDRLQALTGYRHRYPLVQTIDDLCAHYRMQLSSPRADGDATTREPLLARA